MGRLNLISPVFRVQELHRAVGTARLVPTALAWSFAREFIVVVNSLQSPLPCSESCRDMEWTRLTEPALRHVLAVDPALTEREIRRRLAESQRCHLCWVRGELAHLRWETCAEAYLPYLGRSFRPMGGDVLITEAYTCPRFRNQNIHTISSFRAMDQARGNGFQRLIGLAACWNTPALSAMRKAGRFPVGTVGYQIGLRGRSYFTTGSVQFDGGGNLYIASRFPCLNGIEPLL